MTQVVAKIEDKLVKDEVYEVVAFTQALSQQYDDARKSIRTTAGLTLQLTSRNPLILRSHVSRVFLLLLLRETFSLLLFPTLLPDHEGARRGHEGRDCESVLGQPYAVAN